MNNDQQSAAEYSAEGLARVLDNLDVLVYVSDMQTHELLFLNAYGRERWGESAGRKCWEVLQSGQTGPCAFCTNGKLLSTAGKPGPVVVWEFCNTLNSQWYQCRDQAIVWTDGRLVRLEVATDITERKRLEMELIAAREQAESLAYTDMLTGLANRRAYFERSAVLLSQARRLAQPVAVLLFDLDEFKAVNDRYGHAAGDAVLVEVVKRMQAIVRDSDIGCRFGGEEFTVTLTGVDESQAYDVAERLRQSLAKAPVLYEDASGAQAIVVTASVGLICDSSGLLTLDEMLISADEALYLAKKNGRNRVEIGKR